MSQYSEKIIELLCVDHPDLSSWTIICANERAIDPVQYLIHSELGGILPKVEGFNSYITRKNGERLNFQPVPGDEQLLYFIQFIAENFPQNYIRRGAPQAFCPLSPNLRNIKSVGIRFMARSGLQKMNGLGLKNFWKSRRLFESGLQN